MLPDAHAGGYAAARFGGEHGHAATDHATAIYFNPAGLALGAGTRLYIEGLFVHRLASYDRPAAAIDNVRTGTPDDPTAIAANSGEAELSNFLASPFFGVVSDVGVDNLALSLGFFAPFGGQSSWNTLDEFADDERYPGALDGPQRWASIEATQRVLYLSAAGAYRLPGPKLSFGVSVNVVRQTLSLIRARNADGTDDLVASFGVREGRSLIEGSDISVAVGAGVVWEPTDSLRVGVSYQSTPGFGENTLDGTLTNQFGANDPDSIDTSLLLTLPDIYRLAVVFRPSRAWEVRLSGDYTRWSVFERHCLLDLAVADRDCSLADDGSPGADAAGILAVIPRDWQDTFGVRVGGSYWVSPRFEIFAGGAFDSNAVPDETMEAGLMDMNKIISSAGVRYQLLDRRLMLTGAATNVFYVSRDIPERVDDPPFPSRNPDGAGEYTQLINLVTLGAEYRF